MHRFYLEGISSSDKSITITGEDVNHIVNVLRLGVGDDITVSDGSSRDYTCRITEAGSDYVNANIVDIFDSNAELPADIILFQGFPKGDKLELIIQKCVELGVHAIVPVMMDRTIVKLDDKKKAKRLERYNSISEAAAKQSRRGIIPEVRDVMGSKDAYDYAKEEMDVLLFPYELAEGMDGSRAIINEIKVLVDNRDIDKDGKLKIGIFIGPEGGFSEKEAELLKEAGARVMSLGHRILRTETAGMTIMSVLSFMLDN